MPSSTSDAASTSGDAPAIGRITVAEARVLVESGRGVLVDTRSRHLYDNAHATGALSLPLSEIEASRVAAAPPGGLLILYCA